MPVRVAGFGVGDADVKDEAAVGGNVLRGDQLAVGGNLGRVHQCSFMVWGFTQFLGGAPPCLKGERLLSVFQARTFGLCGCRVLPLLPLLEQTPQFVHCRLEVAAQPPLLVRAVDRLATDAAVGEGGPVEAPLFLPAVDLADVRGTDGGHLDKRDKYRNYT